MQRNYLRGLLVCLIPCLLAGLFVLVYGLGVGLIFVFYGREPALMALLCLLVALVPVAIIALILAIINWIVKRANPD